MLEPGISKTDVTKHVPERVVRDRLAHRLGGCVEVAINVLGSICRADTLTRHELIEVKRADSPRAVWSALGQIKMYGAMRGCNSKLRVHVFGSQAKLDACINEDVVSLFAAEGVELTCEVVDASDIPPARLIRPNIESFLDLYTVPGQDGDPLLWIRPTDGFVYVTKMCAEHGKQFGNWLAASGNMAYLKVVARKRGVPVDSLYYTSRLGGTWVDMCVAIEVCGWCSPELRYEMNEIAMRYWAGQLTTEESRDAMKSLSKTIKVERGDDRVGQMLEEGV